MTIEFLTKYLGTDETDPGYCSAWAIHPDGQVFNFLCSPDGTRVRAIRKRMENGKWYTLHAKQAAEWATEIEQAVARKMEGGV